jgi:hypothetical protein
MLLRLNSLRHAHHRLIPFDCAEASGNPPIDTAATVAIITIIFLIGTSFTGSFFMQTRKRKMRFRI